MSSDNHSMMFGEVDYASFFNYNILLFKLTGYWKPDDNMKYKAVYTCYTFICTVIWIAFLLSQMKYISEMESVFEVTAIAYITVTFTIALVKILIIYSNMDKIKCILGRLNNKLFQPKMKSQNELAMATKKYQKRLYFICLYFGVQTYLFFSIIPFLKKEKDTLTGGWFPFDWHQYPNYAVVYVFQNVVTLWGDLLTLNMDTFAAGLMIQIGMQCDMLCLMLENLEKFHVIDDDLQKIPRYPGSDTNLNETSSERILENMNVCIAHYQHIKRLATDVEETHSTNVFLTFVGGGVIICSGLFQLAVVKVGSLESLMFVSYLLCMFIQQLLYCWMGTQLIHKSENIFSSVYHIPWINCDRKCKKNLLQFMTQTKWPIIIKAGGYIQIHISVFISVLRSAYSYLTLLQKANFNADM